MQDNQNVSNTPVVESVPVKYAGFWVRYVAITVDSIIVGVSTILLSFILSFCASVIGINATVALLLINIITILAGLSYYILMTHYKQATLGKMLVGIVVKSDDLQKLTLKKVLLREIVGKLLSSLTFSIGYLMAAFTAKKQGLHDIIAHSVVVYKDPTKKKGAGFILAVIVTCFTPLLIVFLMFSVVLASLNNTRTEGSEATIRSLMSQTGIFMEIYAGENNTYSTADDCSSGAFADDSIKGIISKLSEYNVSCKAAETSYAISAYGVSGDEICIDQTREFSTASAAVDEEGAYCGI
jgi:uncharacterized RDD family membrane protein YckC/Tfp pilus assembly protein PilE